MAERSPQLVKQEPLSRELFSRILAVARRLGGSADLREILNLVIDAMRDTLDAERATVFEFDSASNELVTTVAHGMAAGSDSPRNAPLLEEIRVPLSSGLAGQCASAKHTINVPDAYADQRFNAAVDRRSGFRTRSILTIPLLGHDGELVGVAQVLNKRGGPFTRQDEEIAEALAAQAAVAMRRGRLIEDRLIRQKLENDLALARLIQQSSFPTQMPQTGVLEVAAWNDPAEQTGGDAYDIMARAQDGPRCSSIILFMADATGHGIGPALSVTQLRSMLRMAVRLGAELSSIAQHANQQLCADLPSGRFITAWFGELDTESCTLRSLSAGQGPLLHYRAAADDFQTHGSNAVPLGILEDAELDRFTSHRLEPGDCFAVLSDGIYEACNPQGQMYGQQRVMELLKSTARLSAQLTLERLRQTLDDFTCGLPAEDDRTMIIIKHQAAAKASTN
jgi:phosphoserine phosphatase